MDISEDVFSKRRVIYGKLDEAGFDHAGDGWRYSGTIMNGDLTVSIYVGQDGCVTGKVTDTDSDEEYLPMNIEAHTGSYVGEAREEYRALLEDIAAKCFSDVPFISDQANRIASRIESELGAEAEFPFTKKKAGEPPAKDSESAVFRHSGSNKWFSIIMTIARGKLESGEDSGADPGKMINVMNVKIDPEKLDDLLKEPGLYRCYHMNKKMWITIALDDECPDDRIMELVRHSFYMTEGGTSIHKVTGQKSFWMIPSNPANYDVAQGFRDSGNNTLAWHHRINVMPGDIVYIYQTEPVASIMFECEVLESFLPRPASWGRFAPNSKYRMTLKLLRSFRKGEYPRAWMNSHGIKNTVRGQRSAPPELVEAIGAEI